jgi:hypothetical protein
MKQWIINKLFKLGVWCLRKAGKKFILEPDTELVGSACEIVKQMEGKGNGEWKRAQVLRALINRHPSEKQRDIALAIEYAVRLCSE